MIFSLGNLIVLLVVCIFIVVMRQRDKNNRSLNKVKMYAQNARNDLDALFAERMKHIQDMSIELDVNHKRGKAIAQRIENINALTEQKIVSHEDRLAQNNTKINQLSESLSDIDAMYHTNNEQYNKLQKRSALIEKLFVDLSRSADTLEEFKKSIPQRVSHQQSLFDQTLKTHFQDTQRSLQKLTAHAEKMQSDLQRTEQHNINRITTHGESVVNKIRSYTHNNETRIRRVVTLFFRQERSNRKKIKGSLLNAKSEYNAQLNRVKGDFRTEVTHIIAAERKRIAEQAQKQFHETMEQYLEQQKSHLETIRNESKNKISKLNITHDASIAQVKTLQETMQQLIEQSETEIKTHRESINALIVNQKDTMRKQEENQELQMKTMFTTIENDAQNHVQRLQEHFTESLALLNEQSHTITADLGNLRISTEDNINTVKRVVDIALDRAKRVQNSYTEQEQHIQASIDEHIQSFSQTIDKRIQQKFQFSQDKTESVIDAAQKVANTIQNTQTKQEQFLIAQSKQIEAHIQKSVNSGMAKIDSMSGSLQTVSDKIHKEQAIIKTQLDELADSFFKHKQKALVKINNIFQQKLQRQVDQIQLHFAKHKQKIDQQLEHGSEEINQRIAARIAHIAESFNANIENNRIALEQSLRESSKYVEQQWEEMRVVNKQSLHAMQNNEQHILEKDQLLNEKIVQIENKIEQQQKHIATQFQTNNQQFTTSMQQKMEELSEYVEQIASSKNNHFQQKILDFGNALSSRLETEKENLINKHNAEIESLLVKNKQKIDELSQKEQNEIVAWQENIADQIQRSRAEIADLRQELNLQTSNAMTDFNHRYDSFQGKLENRARELMVLAESKITHAQKNMIAEHAQFANNQKSTIDTIEAETDRLSRQMQTIDKKQHEVNQQIKILNKVASFQESLSKKVSSLQNDITTIDSQRQEVKKIEQEFTEVHDLAKKMQTTFAKINSERRKIEQLEKNWARISGLSETLEIQMDRVEGKYDSVQNLQSQLRDVDALEHTVSMQYERLDKKQEIIESTINGIDANFQNLSAIEERLSTINDGISGLPEQIAELNEQVMLIQKNASTTQEVKVQSKKLEKSLKLLEKRIDEVRNSRDWLARTETRLQEIGDIAEDRLNILQSLAPANAADQNTDLLPQKQRGMITNLARRGWTPEQISQRTKISIGEIELILGMVTHNT